MARIVAKALGGEPRNIDAGSVADARRALNLGADYTAQVNRRPAADADRLSDDDYVTFSPAVKGGVK